MEPNCKNLSLPRFASISTSLLVLILLWELKGDF